jgi:nucleoid-associated protein YejK
MRYDEYIVRHLTIRNVPPGLSEQLEREKHRRGRSLNQTVIDLLSTAVGLGAPVRSNGLGRLAGTWTANDLRSFEEAVAFTEQIDEEHWR